jgi:hypothetical protein
MFVAPSASPASEPWLRLLWDIAGENVFKSVRTAKQATVPQPSNFNLQKFLNLHADGHFGGQQRASIIAS